MPHACVQIFSYDEPTLDHTLDAYADCTIPQGWELSYWACVTPRNGVTHESIRQHRVEIAREHDVFEYVRTPKGKLASRNYAHDMAVASGADVIVSGDGDGPPMYDGYLERLLAPFDRRGVVATNGRAKSNTPGLAPIVNTAIIVEDNVRPSLMGRGSAFTAGGWQRAGPFDERAEADKNVRAVRAEEEFAFRRRLEQHGEVVQTRAKVLRDDRRIKCRLYERPLSYLGREPSAFCDRVGTESFQPREE